MAEKQRGSKTVLGHIPMVGNVFGSEFLMLLGILSDS